MLTIFGFSFRTYGLVLAAAVLGGIGIWTLCFRKRFTSGAARPDAVMLALLTIPLAFLGARLIYCLCRLNSIFADLGGLSFIYRFQLGGYSLVGALLGGWLALFLYSRKKGLSAWALADACIPGAAFALMISRLGEYFTTQGRGTELEDGWAFFPVAVPNEWDEWQLAVFFFEAIAALIILLVSLRAQPKGGNGDIFLMALLFLCLSQIFLESLRDDDSLRFGFVRFNQLCGAGGGMAVLILFLVRCRITGRKRLGRIVGYLSGVLMLVALEFALDKTEINNILLYCVMVCTLALMFLFAASTRSVRQQ